IPQPQEPVEQAQNTEHPTGLNAALEALRRASYGTKEEVRAALFTVLSQIPLELRQEQVLLRYLDDHAVNTQALNRKEIDLFSKLSTADVNLLSKLSTAGVNLFFALAVREGFNWQAQLEAAQQNIERVNAANSGLTLVREYDLAALINALAARNNPDKLQANLALMKEPTLIIAPQGLTLNHLRASLTYNGLAPYVDNLYNPDQSCARATVYIIDAGDTTDMKTQPPAIQGLSPLTTTRQQIRDIMNELGIKLDAHGYALLANLLMSRDPQVLLDNGLPISILNGHDSPNNSAYVADAGFSEDQFDFTFDDRFFASNAARARVSVMAEL
ncbi:hypothetical protein KBC89_05580, partial [Candidatus Woesebacteria bacterium]|nr:hypothetical protein [Candidatus Woesebacteria bacterium]